VSRRVGAWGIRWPKSVEAKLGGRLASQGLVSYHLKSMAELTHSTYKYPYTPFDEIEIRKRGLASYSAPKFILCRVEREVRF
jgi:hypothetical protein